MTRAGLGTTRTFCTLLYNLYEDFVLVHSVHLYTLYTLYTSYTLYTRMIGTCYARKGVRVSLRVYNSMNRDIDNRGKGIGVRGVRGHGAKGLSGYQGLK